MTTAEQFTCKRACNNFDVVVACDLPICTICKYAAQFWNCTCRICKCL